MNIEIICVGKIKEKYIQEGIKDYAKRLQPYVGLKIIEVPDLPEGKKLSPGGIADILEEEGQKIIQKIRPGSYTIALDIQGQMLDSEGLAKKIENLGLDGHFDLTFIIGASNGLADQVLQRADFNLSFSKMTFPHQLMRLVLLEQIYRSFRIINGHPYHK